MFDWYRLSDRKQKRTFWACYSGWALDTYDVQIFSFLLPTLIAVWGLTKAEAGMIGTAALFSSALGGWIAGILSDRFGRVRVLMFTIVWFTAFGMLAGFAQNAEQLLIARALQGLGFGGEWAVGAALMAEVINPAHRGKALGYVQSGFASGWALAVIVATLIISQFPPELAWRIVFWVGVIPAMCVLFLRRYLSDSDAFINAASEAREKASFTTVFKPRYLRTSVISSLMVLGLQGGAYAVVIWVPSLMAERGIASGSLITSILVMAAGSMCGYILTSDLADRWGRRPTLILMSIGSWVVTVSYALLPLNALLMTALSFLVGFFMLGVFAVMGPFLSELFPTEVRTTCMGFAYNLGKTLGALAVTGVGILSVHVSLAVAIGLFCLAAYAITLGALLLLPETRGKRLEDIEVAGEGSQELAQTTATTVSSRHP
ncbi:MFS transporter [Pseudomonas sp. S31]|uniref:MFS transporter n=1 Tax=Pseudomonas sp. S31 TaxID=1564473 RepID=UPI001F1686CC|nr:MFS transporter [Pseudomonas sp. S31]MBK5002425.1 MFS transporter [Pseudomonas sp. S31]